MLKLLLDEHISPAVAHGFRRRHRSFHVLCLAEWHNGAYLGQPDSACLEQASAERLTLITYDRRTIPPLLKAWAEQGRNHAGVVFVDDKTIPPPNIGALVQSLAQLARKSAKWSWTNSVILLTR